MFYNKRIETLEKRVQMLEMVLMEKQIEELTDTIGQAALALVKARKKTVSDKKPTKRKYVKSGKYAKKP